MNNLTVYEVTEISVDAPHEPFTQLFSTYEKAVAYAEKRAQLLANEWECEVEVEEYPHSRIFKIFRKTITVFPVEVQ